MNRLRELRKKKKLTQQQLGEIIGVTKRTIIAWEKEEREIKKDKANQLAGFFNVGLGYLLGYTDNPTIYDDEVLQIIDGEKRSFSKKRNYEEDLKKFISFLREIEVVLSNKQVENIFSLIKETNLFRENDYISEYLNYEYSMLIGSEELYNELALNGYSYTVDYIPIEHTEV